MPAIPKTFVLLVLTSGCTSPGTGPQRPPQDDGSVPSEPTGSDDCDEGDPAVHPDAIEVCNGKDDDCDGLVDDDDPSVDPSTLLAWHPDLDLDGYGDPSVTFHLCDMPDGVLDSTDCDDADPAVSPGAAEQCNDARDDDCNGLADDDDPDLDLTTATIWYLDADVDGFGDATSPLQACQGPAEHVQDSSDCNDEAIDVHPGASETCGDGVDQDCDGFDLLCFVGGTRSVATADAKLVGSGAGHGAGRVAGPGDVDGDGFDDLLVGAAGADGVGAAYLLYGPVTGPLDLATADAKLSGEHSLSLAGSSVSGAGDVDGDGLPDLLVGAEGDGSGGSNAGAAYLVLGPVSGTHALATAEAKLVGEASEDRAGATLSAAGDVDGDGFDDLLIGATGQDAGGNVSGAAYLVLGPVSGTHDLATADAKLIGEGSPDTAGASVSGAGDVDGDGLDDLLIGASANGSGGPFAGAAYLLYGPISGTRDLATADAKLVGENPTASAGASVAGAGDVDGDGLPDLLVGAPQTTVDGAAYLVRGPISGAHDLGSADAKLVAEASPHGEFAGGTVAGAGDVNGDGFHDLLVGDYLGGSATSGIAYLVLGPVSGTHNLATADAKLVGESASDRAGEWLAGGGDVDADGLDDVFVGSASESSRGYLAGASYLVLASSFLE